LGALAIIIEAKFHSGKGSEGLVLDEPDKLEAAARKIALDQLARQYFIGREHCVGHYYQRQEQYVKIERSVVLYVTKHHDIPYPDIRQSVQCVEDAARERDGERIAVDCRRGAERDIYWMNWQSAHRVLAEAKDALDPSKSEYSIASEIVEFLDRRDLAMFRGFDALSKLHLAPCQTPVFYLAEDRKYWAEVATLQFAVTPEVCFYQRTSMSYWSLLGELPPEDQPGSQIFYRRATR